MQYYLPQLPFQEHVRFSNQTISGYPAYSVWIATGWAAFGWVTVYFPVGIYRVFLAITVAIGLGALGAGLRWLRTNWRSPALRSTALPVGCSSRSPRGRSWAACTGRSIRRTRRSLFRPTFVAPVLWWLLIVGWLVAAPAGLVYALRRASASSG